MQLFLMGAAVPWGSSWSRLDVAVPCICSCISYVLVYLTGVDHRWASTYAFMSAISDIDIPYSDIRTKNVGLNLFILIPKEFRYRHQLPFQYRTKSISDIHISKIYKSFPNDPSKIIWNIIFLTGLDPTIFRLCIASHHWATRIYKFWFRYIDQTKVYSYIRYNVGLCTLQSDIGRSDIRLRPISLITDIGLSAHLWWRCTKQLAYLRFKLFLLSAITWSYCFGAPKHFKRVGKGASALNIC